MYQSCFPRQQRHRNNIPLCSSFTQFINLYYHLLPTFIHLCFINLNLCINHIFPRRQRHRKNRPLCSCRGNWWWVSSCGSLLPGKQTSPPCLSVPSSGPHSAHPAWWPPPLCNPPFSQPTSFINTHFSKWPPLSVSAICHSSQPTTFINTHFSKWPHTYMRFHLTQNTHTRFIHAGITHPLNDLKGKMIRYISAILGHPILIPWMLLNRKPCLSEIYSIQTWLVYLE